MRRGRGRARPLAGAREAVAARRLARAWRGTDQAAAAAEDEALRARNAEAAAAGQPAQFIFRSLYLPEQGMFCQLPSDLQLGTRLPVRPRARPAARLLPGPGRPCGYAGVCASSWRGHGSSIRAGCAVRSKRSKHRARPGCREHVPRPLLGPLEGQACLGAPQGWLGAACIQRALASARTGQARRA
jgi:hypothetical protein